MVSELKKIAWFENATSAKAEEKQKLTPPTAQDYYISPEERLPKLEVPRSLFFGGLFQRGKVLREAEVILAKLSTLHQAPDNQIARFFDFDLPTLKALHEREPKRISMLLKTQLSVSKNKTDVEPWFNLVQIALGDNEALLRGLEMLES